MEIRKHLNLNLVEVISSHSPEEADAGIDASFDMILEIDPGSYVSIPINAETFIKLTEYSSGG